MTEFMTRMIERRDFLVLTAGLGFGSLLVGGRGALAQSADRAAAFVKTTGDRLVAVVNGSGSMSDKRRELARIIENTVDVDGVGRFCLGRYWRSASPEQQRRYLQLFHEVMVTNITAKLGEYEGVRFTLGRSRPQDEQAVVSTVVERPNNPPTNVDWVISNPGSNPKIVDVVAEGTSLRITQRSDYAAFLQRNNNSIDSLISAMHQQVAQNG
jgi:phospholipid transport system substrate-binding protein